MNIQQSLIPAEELLSLESALQTAQARILTMTTLSASGHPGGSLSSLPMLMMLYKMLDRSCDRVLVSHGHISPAVYTVLAHYGYIDADQAVARFRQTGSIFEGHIEPDVPGVEWGTGNLGQGLSAACGLALANRLQNKGGHVFTLMGDGEQQKGQISEARRFAVKFGLPMVALVDNNHLQISGDTDRVMPVDLPKVWAADGWQVLEVNGHDLKALNLAILQAVQAGKPVVILAQTIMGKGVSFMENKEKYHGSTLSEADLARALEELGQPNRLEYYKAIRNTPVPEHQPRPTMVPTPLQTGQPRTYEKALDNRSAWGNALADLGSDPANLMAVFDCDLAGSVKTADYAQVAPQHFFQSGIAEHHTAVCAGALSREVTTFWSDFGVFGVDEVYNQLRLNDINNASLKVVVTHVGLDVGEDGKTHQCLDYVGALRNLFGFKVIVPADPNQTDRAIRYTANTGNCLVAMGRSKVEIALGEDGKPAFTNEFTYGKAYRLRSGDHGVLVALGAMTEKALQAWQILAAAGKAPQVWSVSCPLALDPDLLEACGKATHVFTVEDHHVGTGLGSLLSEALFAAGANTRLHRFGVENYAHSGAAAELYARYGLDGEGLARRITAILG